MKLLFPVERGSVREVEELQMVLTGQDWLVGRSY